MRCSGLLSRIQAIEKIGHLECRQGRVPAFVSVIAAGASFRLGEVFAREEAESDRHVEFGDCLRQAARGFVRDVIEVRSLASDHRADGDYGVVALRGGEVASGTGKLPSARHPNHVGVIERDTVACERVERAFDEALRH